MTHQKRYTAEEFLGASRALNSRSGREDEFAFLVFCMLRQAAETDSQVAGLVEALKKIDAMRDYGVTLAANVAREALSKFRGEV